MRHNSLRTQKSNRVGQYKADGSRADLHFPSISIHILLCTTMAGETSAYYSLLSPSTSTQADDSSTSRLLPQVIRKPVPNSNYRRLEGEYHGLSSPNVDSRPISLETLSSNGIAISPGRLPNWFSY
jgi:hypothetical protein